MSNIIINIGYPVDMPDSSIQRPELPTSVAIQGKTGRGQSLSFRETNVFLWLFFK